MSAVLTAYEAWYRDGGLPKYAQVFGHNDEKPLEVALVAEALVQGAAVRSDNHHPSILDIGCGTGRFTVLLLERVYGNGGRPTILVDLVDVGRQAFAMFEATAARAVRVAPQLRGTVGKAWRDVQPEDLSPPYDLVVADHVFYGEPLGPSLVTGLVRLLSARGAAIVTLGSEDSDLHRMRAELGVVLNTAEAFAEVLRTTTCRHRHLDYESRLYYQEHSPVFGEWFCATADADPRDRARVLETYTRYDIAGRPYINNRASIFLLWRNGLNELGSGAVNSR